LFEIGSSLRAARERQGLEFPEVEAATKIRGKYLRALEDEQFDMLLGQTYVKGFLRSYAEFLGLDGQLYVDEFNSRYVVGEEGELPIRARRQVRPHRRRRIQSSVLIAALVGIALVTALVIAAWKSGSPPKQHVVGATPPAVRHHARRATATASITLRGLRSGVFLLVRNGGPTGRVLLNEPLSAGQTKSFTTKKLWINTGTPENLRITVNGKRVQLPGGGPQVFVVTQRGIGSA
jgi:hypothetical protein